MHPTAISLTGFGIIVMPSVPQPSPRGQILVAIDTCMHVAAIFLSQN